MKKLLFLIILFFGILPAMHNGRFILLNVTHAYADDYASEFDQSADQCDPGSDSYDPSICEEATCDPASVNYDIGECDAQTCDFSSVNYDWLACFEKTDQCDESSPTYDATSCERATCDPNSVNYDVDECDAQVCDVSSVNASDFLCDDETCEMGNVNYSKTECDLINSPCNGLNDVHYDLVKAYPNSKDYTAVPGTAAGKAALNELFNTFFIGFFLPGSVSITSDIPAGGSVTSTGQFNVPKTGGGTQNVTGYTRTAGRGSGATSTIYIDPRAIIGASYSPDGMIAEEGHELIHAFLEQNGITGVNEEYLAYTYQAAIYAAFGDSAAAAAYTAAATAAKNADPNFNQNANNAVKLPALPTYPCNP
jgi:hypothetical protein